MCLILVKFSHKYNKIMNNIRNFCIIAHIDHGKSTLADRFLEITGTVEKREMKEQLLDTMDLERERGITIKLQPARMDYEFKGRNYILNLIDTPGHVDFTYEVSRSLAACEGAIILVDATQGVQAQTVANLYLAIEQGLEIIPVLNKIDLPNADVKKVTNDLVSLLGVKPEEILSVSAKTGENVELVLREVIEKVPGPKIETDKPFRALIFDSFYDEYKGVVAYVRVFDGQLDSGKDILMMGTNKKGEALELGILKPKLIKQKNLSAGEIGYIVSGLKDIEQVRVGDTISRIDQKTEQLQGYKEINPMVYAGIFPKEGSEFSRLREAIGKIKLNDAALVYEPESSLALGFGFRCGFLGLLHLDIFQERLRREYDMDIVVTVPSVVYKVSLRKEAKIPSELKKEQVISKNQIIIKSPQELPDPATIDFIEEPIVKLDIVTPKDYIGSIMTLVQDRRGEYLNTEYLDERVILHYKIPLATVIVDFYDKLKSVSSGYASLNYEFFGYAKADVIKMDILIAEEPVEALATIVYKDTAFREGKKIVRALKDVIPRQMFVIKLQAAIGGKIVASERITAMRKDVTAKLYGGDRTRRQKLLNKQKKGKKKMMALGKGSVNVPPEAYMAVLKRE